MQKRVETYSRIFKVYIVQEQFEHPSLSLPCVEVSLCKMLVHDTVQIQFSQNHKHTLWRQYYMHLPHNVKDQALSIVIPLLYGNRWCEVVI